MFITVMDKNYFQKVFSNERMQKYFNAHLDNEAKAILHYQCNIEISEAFYPFMSVFEVSLRNAINRELISKFGTQDWYNHFPTTTGLSKLVHDITKAQNQITSRNEMVTPSKVVAELTLGFWVKLFNTEFELVLWKDLRRAFPFISKVNRKRANISAPLNRFRNLRNRIFHNEPICWNFKIVEDIHNEILQIMGWINKDLPSWVNHLDRFENVLSNIKKRLL